MLKKLSSHFQTSFTLGATLFQKIKLFCTSLVFPLRRVLGFKKELIVEVWLTKFGKKFKVYLTDGSDIGVLKEMFIEEQYNLDLSHAPQTILDLGSNVGYSVVYFKLKYPDARVYAFEPDPHTFIKLQRNVKDFLGVYIYDYAIGGTDGVQTFYVYPQSSMSSSLIKRLDKQEEIQVPIKTLDAFYKEQNITKVDILKFDVEGSEYEVFHTPHSIINVETLIGEMHLDLMKKDEQQFLDLFKNYKIEKIKSGKHRFIVTMHKI